MEAISLRRSVDRQTQVFQDELNEFRCRQLRIKKEGSLRAVAGIKALQETMDEGRLAGTHFSCNHDEPLLLLDAINQMGERLLVLFSQIEKLRVGSYVERVLF